MKRHNRWTIDFPSGDRAPKWEFTFSEAVDERGAREHAVLISHGIPLPPGTKVLPGETD